MSLPKSLEAYPHFEFIELFNRALGEERSVSVGPMPKRTATTIRQKMYNWRRIVVGLHEKLPPDESELLSITRAREWLGITIAIENLPSDLATLTIKSFAGNELYAPLFESLRNQGITPKSLTPEQQQALDKSASAPAARQGIRPVFPCHSALPADLKLYNRDGTDRYTAEQAQADRKRGLGNGMPNDDASPWWYPGYGNLGPAMRPLAARYALPIFSTNDELLEVSQFWTTYADIPVIAHE